jgi:hypothetical protein
MMARDKTDKTDKIPTATLATSEGEIDSPKLQGLLGGELDFWGMIGLGLGASPRAKELILKGVLYEYDEQLQMLADKLKRGRGRPKKSFPNIDVKRAAAVLGADDLWRAKRGKGAPTQKAAIELAQQIDEILCEAEPGREPLFGNMTELKTWQDSVSKGLRELGEDGKGFLKK